MARVTFEVRLPVTAAEAFAWHERPGAFERLSPPWQRVRVVEREGGIRDGARVEPLVETVGRGRHLQVGASGHRLDGVAEARERRATGEPDRHEHAHAECDAEHRERDTHAVARQSAQQQHAQQCDHAPCPAAAVSDTTRPSDSVTTRSAASAASRLCVTMTSVEP